MQGIQCQLEVDHPRAWTLLTNPPIISPSVQAMFRVVAKRVHTLTTTVNALEMRKMKVAITMRGPRLVSESCWKAGEERSSIIVLIVSTTTTGEGAGIIFEKHHEERAPAERGIA